MDKFKLGEIIAKVVRVKGVPLDQVCEKAQDVLLTHNTDEDVENILMDFFERSGVSREYCHKKHQ